VCEPATIMTIATIATAAGTAFAGYTAYQGAKATEATAKMNQDFELRAADDAMARGEKEAMAHYRQVSALRARQTAEFGAAGLDVAFGSPLDVITDTNILGNEDANTIRENAMREAEGHRISAYNYESEAAMAKFEQKAIPISTGLSVAGTLLTGYGKTREMMNPQTTTHGGAKSGMSGRNTGRTGMGSAAGRHGGRSVGGGLGGQGGYRGYGG
jgi:hypothetical protein